MTTFGSFAPGRARPARSQEPPAPFCGLIGLGDDDPNLKVQELARLLMNVPKLERVDLAVIVTPAPTVPAIVRECAQAGVPGAIIISAGFKETGPAGAELEQRILAEARQARMRIIGPNCLGAMRPHEGLNATFAAGMARPGSVGFLSQSGLLRVGLEKRRESITKSGHTTTRIAISADE